MQVAPQLPFPPPTLPTMQALRSRSPVGGRIASSSGDEPSTAEAKQFTSTSIRESLDIESAPLLSQPRRTPTPGGADHENESIDWTMTSLLFLFPALGGLLFGYDIGASSGALLSMTSPTLSGTDWFQLSSFQSGLVVSLSLGGALLGSGAALVRGDALGRRKELLLASVLYTVGALTVACAPSLSVVLAGRLVYGVGIGFAMHAAPGKYK